MSKLVEKIKDLRPCFKICPIIIFVLLILIIIGFSIPSALLIILPFLAILLNVGIMAGSYLMHENTVCKKGLTKLNKMLDIIRDRNFVPVKEVALKLKITESGARSLVYDGIRDGSLFGYTLRGDDIVSLNGEETEIKAGGATVVNCSSCGANFVSSEDIKECPYCGKLYK